jgi:single-strand DNA-binding protein
VHKGEPLVLFADLTIREWQADGGRSGKDADLVAHHVGPDLRWGSATFERPARPVRQDVGAAEQEPPTSDIPGPSGGQSA